MDMEQECIRLGVYKPNILNIWRFPLKYQVVFWIVNGTIAIILYSLIQIFR